MNDPLTDSCQGSEMSFHGSLKRTGGMNEVAPLPQGMLNVKKDWSILSFVVLHDSSQVTLGTLLDPKLSEKSTR